MVNVTGVCSDREQQQLINVNEIVSIFGLIFLQLKSI